MNAHNKRFDLETNEIFVTPDEFIELQNRLLTMQPIDAIRCLLNDEEELAQFYFRNIHVRVVYNS